MLFLELFILLFALATNNLEAIQSNQTCAPVPKDKRQIVCQCSKQLQLRCSFNLDLVRFESKDLDHSLRPILYDQVTLPRLYDPSDPDDMNINFELNKKRYSYNENNFYLYFPNFQVLTSPFIRITFNRFVYIPSFAFSSPQVEQFKSIETVVFELPEVYDFGVDQYAFNKIQITDSLLIEGPFNQITFHKHAFVNSKINELIIGCYCIECESFYGSCRVLFNQNSKYTNLNNQKSFSNSSTIRSIKMYGVEFDRRLDNIPGIDLLEKLEISNSKSNQLDYDLHSTSVYENLVEFCFKNNNLKRLFALNLFKHFPNLKIINLSQNQIDFLDQFTFEDSRKDSLVELVLERNKISKLNSRIFGENLSSLKEINLNQNQIELIEDFTFEYLSSLEYLDLTRNNLNYLSRNTFAGLKNLKKLFLSYNPFKTFDSNTFMHVTNLNRLDIISNTDADWFTFDNSDICLLAYFKCQTQINIDMDQRCNCFVKYTNLIGSSETGGSVEEVKWYKPCLTEDHAHLNRYFDDTKNYLDDLDDLYRNPRDPKVFNTNSEFIPPKIECPKSLVQNCYSKMQNNLDLVNSSCLYNKFISNTPQQQVSMDSSSTQSLNLLYQHDKQIDNPQNSNNKHNYLADDQNVLNENIQNSNLVKMQPEASSLVWNRLSLENSLLIILVGILVVFVISILALFFGVYMFVRRNKYSYHPTDTSYPNDE